jgi:hypothetical protein
MSAPRGPQPGDPPSVERDPAMDALLEYLAATALAPAPDLASRIQVRIAQEPDRTPTRRFLLALVHLRLVAALGASASQAAAATSRRCCVPRRSAWCWSPH